MGAPLRFVPEGTYVVLGRVTSDKGEPEATDDIRRPIGGKLVDVGQLGLSPRCGGFSSAMQSSLPSRALVIGALASRAERGEAWLGERAP